jgi:hypothetical protein
MYLLLWWLCFVPPSEFWLQRPGCLTPDPLTTTHLVVWPLFLYAQIACICSLTFVLCLRIHFLLWLLCGQRSGEFWPRLSACASAHLLTTTHLVVWPLFPHAQIVRICFLTFVSCLRIRFLLWWLCGPRRSSSASQALDLRPRLWIANAHPLTTTHLDV